jgi:uncharacterized protein HemX
MRDVVAAAIIATAVTLALALALALAALAACFGGVVDRHHRNADNRQENRDSQNQSTIHPNTSTKQRPKNVGYAP